MRQVIPTRTVKTAAKAKPQAGSGKTAAKLENGGNSGTPDLDDLLPRTDISGQLGSKVMASLASSNWKERNHTMEDIENIIKTAVRIQPNVGDLVPGLKACFPLSYCLAMQISRCLRALFAPNMGSPFTQDLLTCQTQSLTRS